MTECLALYKSYGEQTILRELDCQLPESGFVLFMGESGSGKTTFLNILAGAEPFEKGRIVLDGKSYTGQLPPEAVKETEYIPQDPFFADFLSVEENLLLLGCSRKEAEASLARFGLEEKARRLPGTLSGGERQRLALARALLQGKKRLLVDEPTASLDSANKERIFSLLKALSESCLILCASHDPMAESFADEILYFSKEDGRVRQEICREKTGGRGEVSSLPLPVRTLPPAATYLAKWFRSRRRERVSGFLFLFFLVLSLSICALADTPRHKNDATMNDLYHLNVLHLLVSGNYRLEDVLPQDESIREIDLDYDNSCPTEISVGTDELMHSLPDYAMNFPVLPDEAALCPLSSRLAAGSYFNGPDQIILSSEMAEHMGGAKPEKLIGKTISEKIFGRGKVILTIVGIFEPFGDAERIYLDACGAQMYYGSFYSPEGHRKTYYASASTLLPLWDDEAFHSSSGGWQRGYHLFFDSFYAMSAFYSRYADSVEKRDENGIVRLMQEGIPLEYSLRWPLLSSFLLPLSGLMMLLTALYYASLKRTELRYNNQFTAVFDYAGYARKSIIRTMVLLSLAELTGLLLMAFCLMLGLTAFGNRLNEEKLYLPLKLFTYNPWLLGGFCLGMLLFTGIYLTVALRRLARENWYRRQRESRDLL